MSKTKIEWVTNDDGSKGRTWNPITGCTKISAGCANCYAERMSRRFGSQWRLPEDDPFRVTFHPARLEEPLRWRKNSKVFVCSMADIFHDDVTDAVLDQIFGVMLATKVLNNRPDHTFMVLTKRAERMHRYFTSRTPAELLEAWAFATDWVHMEDGDVLFHEYVEGLVCHKWDKNGSNSSGSEYKEWGYPDQLFPLSNIWIGVTAENQEQANIRIPLLLDTPAVMRFVSVEPMIGPVDIVPYIGYNAYKCQCDWHSTEHELTLSGATLANRIAICNKCGKRAKVYKAIDWVICGGESGPGARPVHPNWIRSLRDQCVNAEVPFLFKQWGEWEEGMGKTVEDRIIALDGEVLGGGHPDHGGLAPSDELINQKNAAWMARVGKKTAGRLLDGQLWDQYPC